MSDTVALTGIIVLGLVIGVVAIVGIVFGIPVRSKANRDGFELAVDPPHSTAGGDTPAAGPLDQDRRTGGVP